MTADLPTLARPETRFITFDCYGTLIDWETGIHEAVSGWLARHDRSDSRENILRRYAAFEPEAQLGPYRRYRDVLAEVMRRFAREYGLPLGSGEDDLLADSLGDWRPFPDTAPVLDRLAGAYRLAILSNIDRDLFEATRAQLPPVLDTVITAEDVRSYKPAHGHFRAAMETFRCRPGEILHAAESLFHDIMPCRELGIPHCWINRRSRTMGTGATRSAMVQPEAEADSLEAFARRVGR